MAKSLIKITKPIAPLVRTQPAQAPKALIINDYLTKQYPQEIKCFFCKKGTCVYHTINDYHKDIIIINTVKTIINGFKNDQNSEQLLIAQAQSGKSDVIKRICELFNNNKTIFATQLQINNIYVIICAADNDLKEDHQNEFFNFIESTHILHLPDLIRLCKKFNTPLSKSQRIYDTDQEILETIIENCLIIFDESHCDLQEKATIDIFREKLNIAFNNHTNKSVKILNVSATAYDQMKANIKTTFLSPRKGYYGIIDMNKTKKLLEGFDLLNKEGFNKLLASIKETLKVKSLPIGYYIIRVNNSDEETILKNLIGATKNINYDIDIYNMKTNYDINKKYLDTPPDKVTFIIIMNRLRKGKRINKQYIIAVHDKNKTGLTHTTYQGLPGRMTGYNANRKALIYCDKDKAIEHINWIESNYSPDKLPEHAQWINKNNGTIKKNCILATSTKSHATS